MRILKLGTLLMDDDRVSHIKDYLMYGNMDRGTLEAR